MKYPIKSMLFCTTTGTSLTVEEYDHSHQFYTLTWRRDGKQQILTGVYERTLDKILSEGYYYANPVTITTNHLPDELFSI